MSEKEELIVKYTKHAAENNMVLQPNAKMLDGVLKGLMMRREKFGEYYCPCRALKEDKEENKKIICPCIYHKEEVETDGHCKCFLFVKKED